MKPLPDPNRDDLSSPSWETQNGDEMSLRERSSKQSQDEGIASPPPADRNDIPSDAGLDLPPDEAALALELRALAENARPEEAFVTRLEGELTRQRLAARPRGADSPTWNERLRHVLHTAWGWTLPTAAVVVLILIISLLLQMRPRQGVPAGEITVTTSPAMNPTPSDMIRYGAIGTIYYIVHEGDTLPSIAENFGITVEAIVEANRLGAFNVLPPGMSLTIPSSGVYPAPNDSTYIVQGGDSLDEIASHYAVTVEALLKANNLSVGDLVRAGQTLIIPPSAVTPSPGGRTYLVQEGDTLEGIASLFHISVDALLDANMLGLEGIPYVGMSLTIPPSSSYPAPNDTTYIVKEGDTLAGIARSHGVSIQTLLEANNLRWEDLIRVGQLLSIPSAYMVPTQTEFRHVVQAGDTLSSIASSYGVTVEAILVANYMQSGDSIQVGQMLIIPREGGVVATPSAPASTLEPTPVPPGVFALLFFPPLVLDYDPALWSDVSNYTDTRTMVNYLQARDLQTCSLGPQGHSGFYPTPQENVTLGAIRYQVTTVQDTPPGKNTSYYIDTNSLADYSYANGVTVLTFSASPTEWDQCKVLAEAVLSSLHGEAQATTPTEAQALLVKLQNLVALRNSQLLHPAGWLYLHDHGHNTSNCDTTLPNGATSPCDSDDYYWYELNAEGEIVTEITRQLDPSGQAVQETVTKDGTSRNLSFGIEGAAPLTTTYSADWNFAADAGSAVTRGASLSQASSSLDGEFTDQFILRLKEGNLLREAVFDPQTGALLALSNWLENADNLVLSGNTTILNQERVDQPPAEALALLDQPLQPFHPLPPRGDTIPPGFDLAYSTLSLKIIYGDDFNNPSFFYGDIYADGTYLVGRVDFGAVPGGYCERSPDGLKLAFNRITLPASGNGSPTQAQLRWMDLNAPSDVHTAAPDLQMVSPAGWAPDNTRLAFIACDAAQSCGLYTYDTASGALQRLADGGNAIYPPVWDPGGVEIAFQTGSGEAPQTVVVDAGSGMVIASPGWQPVFPEDRSGQAPCEGTPAMPPSLSAAPADWLTYDNAAYGFAFRYSPDWALEELTHSIQLKQGDLVLGITFENTGEHAAAYRTGVGAGDIVPGGHVSFFGQALARQLLVYQGKTKAVLYKKVEIGGVTFTLSLDDFRLDYNAVDLSAELQQQVNQVVESFTWIPTPPPQTEPTTTPTVQPFVLVVAAQQDWVPIYSGPGVEYPQVGEVANNAQFTQIFPLGCNADETRIAFQRPGFEGQTAWIPASDVQLNGQVMSVEAAPPLPTSTPAPAAPPDSMRIAGRIAFVSMRDGYPVIYAMNADGSGLTVLVNDLGGLMDLDWSPDGQQLSFEATSRQAHVPVMFTMDANGGPWYQVDPTNPAFRQRIEFSPDGKRKVYIDTNQGGQTFAFVSAADGSDPVNLSGSDPNVGGSSNPVWSPDGGQIAIIEWFFDKTSHAARIDLVTTSADGTQHHVLVQGGVTPGWPSWSPDGQYIAYGADGDIDVVRLADAQAWRLTEDPADDSAPAWNPSTSLAPLPGERPVAPVAPAYTDGDEELSYKALRDFLDSLYYADYPQAAALYGGPYDVLVDNNWSLDPRDKAALLKNACEVNGYQCLQSSNPSLVAHRLPDTYVFVVEFTNADGSLFVQGPCCGGSAADWTPVSKFEFVVVKVAEGQFVVQQLPPPTRV